MEPLVLIVALTILAGECSALLWLPALAGAAWLAAKERKSRKVLLPLAAGCLLCAAVLWIAPRWARGAGVRLRDWVTTGPACLLALLFAALLLAVAYWLIRRSDRRWKKWLVRAGAMLSLWAVAVWGTLAICLTARTETVGEWQGRKVVMQKLTWMETTYDYYAYNGAFFLGESLGWSEEPWGEDKGRGILYEEAVTLEITLDCETPVRALGYEYALDGEPVGGGDVQRADDRFWRSGEQLVLDMTGGFFPPGSELDGFSVSFYLLDGAGEVLPVEGEFAVPAAFGERYSFVIREVASGVFTAERAAEQTEET